MNRINIVRYVMALALCAAFPAPARSQEMQKASQGVLAPSAESPRSKTNLAEKFEYFDDGKVRTCSKLTPEGNLVGKRYYYHDGRIRKEERYDKAGDKIEESNYDEGGKLDDNFDGWAAKRWLYKDGNLRVESIYGEDGHLTERKIYNDLGDLAERQYVGDGKIDPDEEFNRGSVVTDETDKFYDRYSRPTGSVTTEVDDFDDMLWN